MELTIHLEEHADLAFIKKLLTHIKGIKSVEHSDEDKTYSWEEIENSKAFREVLDKSFKQVEQGKFVEHSQELMERIFGK